MSNLTPEMIEAGVDAYYRLGEIREPEDVVELIYDAMASAKVEAARENLARFLHLTFAKLESDYEDWNVLGDEQRYFYRQGIEALMNDRETVLAALGCAATPAGTSPSQ